jgi:hypothetical protein
MEPQYNWPIEFLSDDLGNLLALHGYRLCCIYISVAKSIENE